MFYGNPDENALWDELSEFLFETEFDHASGAKLKIHATAIDSGATSRKPSIAGSKNISTATCSPSAARQDEKKAIRDGSRKIEQDHKGRVRKRGLMLWHVGTNKAKDVLHNRLQIEKPGPGYIHFSADLSERWFKQYTAEVRVPVRTQNGMTGTRWECPSGRRNESGTAPSIASGWKRAFASPADPTAWPRRRPNSGTIWKPACFRRRGICLRPSKKCRPTNQCRSGRRKRGNVKSIRRPGGPGRMGFATMRADAETKESWLQDIRAVLVELGHAEHSARDMARALFEDSKAARRHGALHPGRRPGRPGMRPSAPNSTVATATTFAENSASANPSFTKF